MPCSASSGRALLLAALSLVPGALPAQLTTGTMEGTLRGEDGKALAGAAILIAGEDGFETAIRSDSSGRFTITLPYGRYRVCRGAAHCTAHVVSPLGITRVELIFGPAESLRAVPRAAETAAVWSDATGGRTYPEGFSLAGVLLSREPASVTEPLDFTGFSDNRLAVESQRAASWTATQFKLHGMEATDPYQPGRAVLLPDVAALADVAVRSTFTATEVGLFLAQPGSAWHGSLSTANTGAALFSNNLPPVPARGQVLAADQYRWFTRDRLEVGGPVTRWADIYASGAGQWAGQTVPLAPPGTEQRSRMLFGNVRGRIRAGARDVFDALYSGSRVDLSSGGLPAGLEAYTGNRMAPGFVLPGGFLDAPETDHLDSIQAGWTHVARADSRLGTLQLRYAYSATHLNTATPTDGQSRVDLFTGEVSGAPPLANLAVRLRQEVQGAWQPAVLRAAGTRHRMAAGGGFSAAEPRNRFHTPSGLNLITAGGAPAFVTEFNTPLNSRELVRAWSAFATDHVSLTPSLSVDAGVLADFSRGSLPPQSSPKGAFAPSRTFAAQPDLIAWNSLSSRVGFAWQAPRARGLVFRGKFSRQYVPLAGRYLDFGNPNSLGGSTYEWTQTGRPGPLLLRFGGPYSSISGALRRPYADEFEVGAEFPLLPRTVAGIRLFRRDDKQRLAALDTGVPFQAFTPVPLADPGPDGIPGTFDDQRLTVYAQNPATLGQDRYLLTNPAGLRMMNTGLLAEIGTEWRALSLHASFTAEKSYGPTNPGDAVYENDPGVIGTLFLDPNTALHAAGRGFVDRAYVGKIQAAYRLPSAWGGIEVASVADYMDGLVFARQLPVLGLPQGPFLVAATVRGSPEGGHRAEYVINWNLRLSRRFTLPLGTLMAIADILNVTNAGQKIQENDLSGPAFNQRLPVAIQPPRFLRVGFRYDF